MKKIIPILLIGLVLNSFGQSIENVKTNLNALTSSANLKHASVGFVAINVADGKTVTSKNRHLSLTPASTLKLITTATALEVFGPKHRFKTKIAYSGKIDTVNKVLLGNIYIVGGGDPTLGSEHFKSSYGDFLGEWSLAIKKLGIDSIHGKIIGDGSYFADNTVPGSWIWSDMGNYYGSGPWGLSIYDNTYKLVLKSGQAAGDPTEVVRTEPEMKGIQFNNQIKAANSNSDNGYIYGAPYSNYRILEGTIPKARNEFTIKGSIPNPPLFAAQELHKTLLSSGFKITESPSSVHNLKVEGKLIDEKRVEIFSTNSPMLKDIIERTNMKSVNLYAEHLLVHIGIKKGSNNNTESASEVIDNFWQSKGINTSGMFINDGSGLSRKDAVTVNQLALISKYMIQKSPYKSEFKKSLPIAGKSGTLRSMCKSTSGNGRVHAKSGSMSRVRSYAGYIETVSGKTIAVAIIINNYKGSNSAVKNQIAKIFDAIASM